MKTYTKTAQTNVKISASAMVAVSATALFLSWGMIATLYSIANFSIQSVGSDIDLKNHGSQKFIIVTAYEKGPFAISKSKKEILDKFVNNPDSVANFIKMNSYNQVEMVGMDGAPINENDIFGPYAIDAGLPRDTFIASVINKISVTLSSHIRIILLTTKSPGIGGTVNYYNIGSSENPNYVYIPTAYNISGSELLTRKDIKDAQHEILHSLGLGNDVDYYSCNPDPLKMPDDCNEVIFHYGDPYDANGQAELLAQSNASSMESATWLRENLDAPHRIETISFDTLSEDNTYFLTPISSNEPGLKALKIPHINILGIQGESRLGYIYIEWHQPIGTDAGLTALVQEKNSDLFDGVLIHMLTSRYDFALIHPETVNDLVCTNPTSSTCPKAYRTALHYGNSYTDPSTGIKITVGQVTENGLLPIIVDMLGRTDFTPPENVSATIVSQPDDCTAVVQINATDEGGISKVSVYKPDFGNFNLKEENLIVEFLSPPYQFTYMGKYMDNGISIRVEDNAKDKGGLALNNSVVKYNIPIEADFSKCFNNPSIIKISSPYLNEQISTANLVPEIDDREHAYNYRYSKPLPMNGELDLEVMAYAPNNEELFSQYSMKLSLDECINKICGECGGDSSCNLSTGFISSGQQIHLYKNLSNFPYYNQRELFFSLFSGNKKTNLVLPIFLLPPKNFKRGDTDGDGTFIISDAMRILDYLFVGNVKQLGCMDAADANDDGIVNVGDSIFLLNYLFTNDTLIIPEPFNALGNDPTEDNLGCAQYP